ncbi:MAG: primosomal protein N' [Phycisphaerales bacterium]|nr:primosomal protein N' [Phycisphaerales bacterium]
MELFERAEQGLNADDEARYVRVVVERGIEGSAGLEGLTYRGGDLEIGRWVTVPLGRAGKQVGGVVVASGGRELLEGLDPSKVKSVIEAGQAALSSQQVALARWMAWYYVCPLGLVVKAMLPGAVKKAVGHKVRRVVRPTGAAPGEQMRMTPAVAKAWAGIAEIGAVEWPMDARVLATRLACANAGPVKKLVEAGLLEIVERHDVHAGTEAWLEGVEDSDSALPLSEPQRVVVEGIWEEMNRAQKGATPVPPAVHLVRGVTGSGKTEVYLQLIARVLAQGRGAIVLVPEIALTPQTVRRFSRRFGRETIAVMHSRLTGAQRNRTWSACAEGRARVLIGPRSAVLAPMPELGLIVVDEEHDASYKQDSAPRYNGRDVAIKRGQLEGACVVLGSATPSMESWHNAEQGRFALWTLDDRVGGGTLPRVKVVDLASERRERFRVEGARGPSLDLIGPTLEQALRETLDRGSQAIVLLNRRGEAGYVGCASAACGWAMRCEACDALMTAHRMPAGKARRYLRCHHCQAGQMVPAGCPACAGRMVLLNAGTQHAEEELERRLGLKLGEDLARVDSDSMHSSRSYFDVLEAFGAGRIRVLVGTQMIAKGLDFPNVGLVCVLNADTALVLPDFRARERTFQLISQVAGRAGRGDAKTYGQALVLVQTMHPGDPAIERAARHQYVEFAHQELKDRKAAGLPPARRMARIVVRHTDAVKARRMAEDAAEQVHRAARGVARVDGPNPCVLSRIAGRYRFEVRVLAGRAGELVGVLNAVREREDLTSDATFAIDVDPVSVL